jgi:cysteine synthase A
MITETTKSKETILKKIDQMWRIVGNSPLLEICFTYKGEPRRVFVKSEHFNLTGSIKDRMALYILQQAYIKGHIKPGDTIVEATSGNTGIAFSSIGKALGHNVIIVMPDWMSKERVDIIRSLGATIVPVSKEKGGFLGSIRITEEIAAKEPDIFLPCQFANDCNAEAHEKTTGPELYWQLKAAGILPDAFTAGVGTGGTIMGVGRFLKTKNPEIKLYPMEPAESPTLTTGHNVGTHRIQGISDEFIPAIVKLEELNEVIMVHDGDAILMAQKLACQLGLAVGISSGANFISALIAQDKLPAHAVVATIFSDSNKKYLTTDLVREEPVKDGYLSPDVELTEYIVHKKICETCPDSNICHT